MIPAAALLTMTGAVMTCAKRGLSAQERSAAASRPALVCPACGCAVKDDGGDQIKCRCGAEFVRAADGGLWRRL